MRRQVFLYATQTITTQTMDILHLLSRPIAFHRCFVSIAGGVEGAVLLSQAIYWNERAQDARGFYKSTDEWQQETGLTAFQQRRVREVLRNAGILIETPDRLQHKIYYKVNAERLHAVLQAQDATQEAPAQVAPALADNSNTTVAEIDMYNPRVCPPTLQDVLAYAETIGMRKEDAQDVYLKQTGVGWVDGANRLIVNWQSYLVRMKAVEADKRGKQSQIMHLQGNGNTQRKTYYGAEQLAADARERAEAIAATHGTGTRGELGDVV